MKTLEVFDALIVFLIGSSSLFVLIMLLVFGAAATDPPPLKWSDLRYVFDIKEDCNGKEAIQA